MKKGLFSTAKDISAAIKSGSMTSRDITSQCLDQIKRLNPKLNSIVILMEEEASKTAKYLDAEFKKGKIKGPLHGIPVTVKEAFNVKGYKTTVNFNLLSNNVAKEDSIYVKRLKDAGAVILGKTNIPTMLSDYQCYGPLYPTANNPYDTTRTPGGSTGGGAAAVASGMSFMEIGSDIGGSVRAPAHFCGLFGLKPTENAYMQAGHVPPLPNSKSGVIHLASFGPLARSAKDIELIYDVIHQPDWIYLKELPIKYPSEKKTLNKFKIGWTDDFAGFGCSKATNDVLHGFIKKLNTSGVKSQRKSIDPKLLSEVYKIWGRLFGFFMGQDNPPLIRLLLKMQFGMGYGTEFGKAISEGLNLKYKEYTRTLGQRIECIAEFQKLFDDIDIFVCPDCYGPAIRHCKTNTPIEIDGTTINYLRYYFNYNTPFNVSGQPVMIVPAGQTKEGLPIGLQLVGPSHSERMLIDFSKLIDGKICSYKMPEIMNS